MFVPRSGQRARMGSIGRYIFRTTFGAFAVVLVSVTTLMWITQALRDVDIVTNQGQTLLVFIGITGLVIPLLTMIIAPIAMMIAVAHVLNRLSNDSELIVMNAAGMPPWSVFRPILAVSFLVALMVAAIGVYVSPKALRELALWITEVRTDLVTNIVQPGNFTVLEGKLTLHIRERLPNGQLQGIFIDDQRDPKERATFVAERGDILKSDSGIYLVLESGSMQRLQVGERDPTIVLFDKNAFDLSRLVGGPINLKYSVRERYFWELYNPDQTDPSYAEQKDQIRAEFHDRITAPLYPLAFAIVTFAYLGAPRTNRQSRAMSLFGAIGVVALLRGIGFVGILSGNHTPAALITPYLALAATFGLGCWGITRGIIIEPPAFISDAITTVIERLSARWIKVSGASP